MDESDSALEAMLVAAVKAIWHSPDRDQLTVNNVYKRAEADNGLGDRYFKNEARKDWSRAIVMAAVDELNKLDESDAEQPLSNAPSGKDGKEPEDKSDDEEEETKPTPQKKKRITKKSTKPAPARGRKRKAVSEDEEDDDESEFSEPEAKVAKVTGRKGKGTQSKSAKDDKDGAELSGSDTNMPDASTAKAKKADDDDSSSLSSVVIDEEPPPKQPKKSKKAAPADEAGNDSDSLSSVIDDGPPAKKKAKTKGPVAKKGGTSAPGKRKSSTAGGGAAAAAEDVSPADAEIKKLQGQLVKCGVRKIWGIELKKYGDDTRARIQHLRDMLREVGMDGRFSEAKAREIKEKRELAKELEAVTEMNDLWGSTGRRARRNAAPKRNLKEDSGEDEEDEEDEEGDEDGTGSGKKKKGRKSAGADTDDDDDDDDGDGGEDSDAPRAGGRRRVRPELAFLGDESDSD